jgi:hypothetical protein
MAGADTLSDMLRFAGYEHICVERYDMDVCLGRSLEDAIEFAMAFRTCSRDHPLRRRRGARAKASSGLRLRETLARYQRSNGVLAGSSSWFIAARNPPG